jgi:tetratricopeptide (TPR) repeat protein
MTSQTHWLPGIVVLVLGLIGGAIYLLTSRKKAPAAIADETQLDLEKRAQLLIEQLKELATERHHLGEERYAAEKSRLELAAADALRARDAYVKSGNVTTAVPKPSAGFFARHPQLTGALWGAGVVIFFVGLGLLLSQEQHPRGENGLVTGTVGGNGAEVAQGGDMQGGDAQTSAQADAEFQNAVADARAHPENLQLAQQVSHELLRAQELDQAQEITDRALAMEPFDPELRTHHIFLTASRGDVEKARAALEHIGDVYPHGGEALLFRGMLDMQTGHMPDALEDFERYAAEIPADQISDEFANGLEALRAQVKQGAAQ